MVHVVLWNPSSYKPVQKAVQTPLANLRFQVWRPNQRDLVKKQKLSLCSKIKRIEGFSV